MSCGTERVLDSYACAMACQYVFLSPCWIWKRPHKLFDIHFNVATNWKPAVDIAAASFCLVVNIVAVRYSVKCWQVVSR